MAENDVESIFFCSRETSIQNAQPYLNITYIEHLIRVPEDYPLIQWAINAADSGDTIIVSLGIYNERIVVNKTVNLVGQNPDTTVIDAQGTGAVVTVTAPNVNVTGFTIKNGEPWGITGGYLVSNNIVENNGAGIKDAKIIKNNIVRNNGAGFSESWGILAHNSLIEGNTVLDNLLGLKDTAARFRITL